MSDGTYGSGNEDLIRLFGAIPGAPVIVCKDNGTAIIIGQMVKEYGSTKPMVIVAEEWPDTLIDNAIVMLPLRMLGTDAIESFGLDYDISERAEKALRFIITYKMAHDGENPSYREIGASVGQSTRAAMTIIDELEEAGLVKRRVPSRGIVTTIGKWRPDKNLAKLSGVGH